MKRIIVVSILALIAIFGMGNTMSAASKKDEAKAMVRKAIQFYKANGKEKTLEAITAGKFKKDELYVFAYSKEGVMLAHPVNKSLIGKNLIDVPDDAGKYFRKEIVQKAKASGIGWVDYKYKNPKTERVEDKTTYFKKVDGIIFCCGVYK
ncbi:MAG: cache domain-containing protein [Bacteroidota bacterium]